MARKHVAKAGGIAEFHSRLPEIAAALPLASLAVAERVASDTAEGAIARSSGQYEGENPFALEVRSVEGTGETRGGVQRSGAYISGWTLATGGTKAGGQVLEGSAVGIYADWYWFFGEFGTSRQPARPFMIPALEEAYAKVHPTAKAVFKGAGIG